MVECEDKGAMILETLRTARLTQHHMRPDLSPHNKYLIQNMFNSYMVKSKQIIKNLFRKLQDTKRSDYLLHFDTNYDTITFQE